MNRPLIRWIKFVSVTVVTVMLISGGWRDLWLWAYLAAWSLVLLCTLFSINEDLARERFHPPEPGADRLWLRAVRILALAHVIVGALDAGRWHVAPVPTPLRGAGLVGMVLFSTLIVLAMRTNRFFSSVVRIQSERGHRVVDTGPYARVRHPGYAGMILVVPCSGLALGSWLAVATALVYSVLVFRRVVFEDAFLQRNLPGYADYARRVPYRLLPGGW